MERRNDGKGIFAAEINRNRPYTLEIVDIEEAPVSYELPNSPVSHVHDESAHWREVRFAQMLDIVMKTTSFNQFEAILTG